MTSEQAEKFAKKYGYAALIVEIENAIIERCAVKCDEHAANCKQKADKAWEVPNLQSIHASWTLEGIGATESAANIRSMKAPTP